MKLASARNNSRNTTRARKNTARNTNSSRCKNTNASSRSR